MRPGMQKVLFIATGGICGFVLTFAGFILWIGQIEAHRTSRPTEGHVYGVFLPSLGGFLVGSCAMALVRMRRGRRPKTAPVHPVN